MPDFDKNISDGREDAWERANTETKSNVPLKASMTAVRLCLKKV